ncbi:MAG: type I-B CRISPR-associated protein Cas5b [bacterium]|nr:type I-B CRISPR-associated protein Cas5b [bacterium]
MEKLLIFDIFAPFAHFRVPYTTTSPITYPIPPKTAVAGIVSSIIGIDKKEYINFFNSDNFKVGIRILNPIKIVHISENFLNVKDVNFFSRWKKGKNPRTQIKIEFLKNVCYRLYIWHSNERIYKNFRDQLLKHQSYYTLCLGLSECIANYEYKGEYNVHINESKENPVLINSVIPIVNITKESLVFDENVSRYLKVHIPVELSKERELLKTEEILIERDGRGIKLKNVIFIECNNENIFLF